MKCKTNSSVSGAVVIVHDVVALHFCDLASIPEVCSILVIGLEDCFKFDINSNCLCQDRWMPEKFK
jgi:hypothetical protein